MSRWRIIGKRDGIQRGGSVYQPRSLAVHRGYRESIPIPGCFLPSFHGLLSSFFPSSFSLSLSFPLCPHRRARSRLAPFVSFVSLLVRLGVISAQEEAFDLRFCGERAIKKCRENNIATVKSVALNPFGRWSRQLSFRTPRFLVFRPVRVSSLLRPPPLALCRLSNATVNAGLYRFAGFDGEARWRT